MGDSKMGKIKVFVLINGAEIVTEVLEDNKYWKYPMIYMADRKTKSFKMSVLGSFNKTGICEAYYNSVALSYYPEDVLAESYKNLVIEHKAAMSGIIVPDMQGMPPGNTRASNN